MPLELSPQALDRVLGFLIVLVPFDCVNGSKAILLDRVDGLLKGRLALQGLASPWTTSHFDLTGFPVDVWIVVFQPCVSKNHLVPAKISYLSYYLFLVTLEINDYFSIMSDVTSRVTCSIHVVYWYGVRQQK